jgi:NitT/TauT family transport system substrate-binding protein
MRWYRRFPVVLFAKAAQGIASPKDLEGKRVGIPGLFGASYVGWQAIVYASGIDPDKVRLESIGFTQASAVSQDQVDAAMDYLVNGPVQLRLAGEEVSELPVADYVDLPSNGIITNDKTLEERPEVARALVAATMRGLRDTLADPDAAFDISLKYIPEAVGAQEDVSRAIFDASLELWRAEEGELGVSDPEAWSNAASFMKEMGLIQSDVNADELFSNDYLP